MSELVLQKALYHGTTKSFNKFDLKYCGKGTNKIDGDDNPVSTALKK